MTKYGTGLNNEIAKAVKAGTITEPFTLEDVRQFSKKMGWIISSNYLNVCLSNGASDVHSPTYRKIFIALGNGKYKLR